MSVVDTAKTAYDLAKKGMTVEFQEKIMQLREEALELQEENLRLKRENRELREQIELRDTVHFKHRLCWRDGDEVPFCPYCYEKSKRLIHLSLQLGNLHKCQDCKATYRRFDDSDDFIEVSSRLP